MLSKVLCIETSAGEWEAYLSTARTQESGSCQQGTQDKKCKHASHQQEHRLLPGFLLVPSRKAAQVHKSNIELLFNIDFNNINLFD